MVITETVRLVNSISHSSPEDGSLCPWATRYVSWSRYFRQLPKVSNIEESATGGEGAVDDANT